ncbi:M16 family metallopeptidase [Sphingobacterium sp. LRF_L2]|uniref:M16 family metallopeptidase n=1 Tax=Sphingobacterium sp. LRF_L2 TaxID=3369421 RepID=UPI003F62424C
MKFKFLVAGILLGLAQMGTGTAQQLELDASVRMGELPNGFRYFIKENKSPENRAVLYLANKVGSILEEESERGLAHFIEHMNFKGTTHFPKNELIDYLEKAGVKFGADLNAYTSFDETVYQLPIPTDDPVLWKNGLQIMRDWAAEALLDKAEFEKERGVILEEKRLQQNAAGRLREQYMSGLYNGSRYADRLPIGLEQVIAHADIQVLRDFYKKWYRPDLQALIIVGDIQVEEVERQVETIFGDLKKANDAPARLSYEIPLLDSVRFIQAKDKELSQYQIEYLIKRRKNPLINEEQFRDELVQQLFNNLIAGRLQEISRKSSTPYIGMQVSSGGFLADLEMLNVRIALSPERWETGFKAAWTELQRIQRFGFTTEELTDVIARFNSRLDMQLKEKDKITSLNLVEDYLQYFLHGDHFLTVNDKIALTRKFLDSITLGEIQKYLNDFLKEKDQIFLVTGADKEGQKLPSRTEVFSWVDAVTKENIAPYVQDRKDVSLFETLPVGGKVLSESTIAKFGITKWTLSNGVQVYAKPTTNKNDEILFTAFSPGGSSLYADSDYYSVMNAPAFIVNSGIGMLNANQLSQFLNAKGVQVMPYIGEREEGISGASISKDLESGLGLLHLYMTNSRMDTARFEVIMDRSKTAMRNRVDDPKRAFADTVGNVLGGYHFRRQPSSMQTLDLINRDRIKTVFQERFSNAADFTFIFVGSFDLDSLQLLTERYLGSLPASSTREQAKDLKIRVPKGKIRKDLIQGEGDKGTVQLVYSAEYTYNDKNNISLDALKTAVTFRLTERLRKQEGGVYSPSVQITKAKQPLGFYALVISFDCDPAREEDLIAAVREELSKLRKEGLTTDELSKFVAEEQRDYELQAKSNQFLLSYLKGQLDKNEPLDSFAFYQETLRNLKLTDVNKKLSKFLNLDNEIIVTLRPQK